MFCDVTFDELVWSGIAKSIIGEDVSKLQTFWCHIWYLNMYTLVLYWSLDVSKLQTHLHVSFIIFVYVSLDIFSHPLMVLIWLCGFNFFVVFSLVYFLGHFFKLKYVFGRCKYDEFGFWSLVEKKKLNQSCKIFCFLKKSLNPLSWWFDIFRHMWHLMNVQELTTWHLNKYKIN